MSDIDLTATEAHDTSLPPHAPNVGKWCSSCPPPTPLGAGSPPADRVPSAGVEAADHGAATPPAPHPAATPTPDPGQVSAERAALDVSAARLVMTSKGSPQWRDGFAAGVAALAQAQDDAYRAHITGGAS